MGGLPTPPNGPRGRAGGARPPVSPGRSRAIGLGPRPRAERSVPAPEISGRLDRCPPLPPGLLPTPGGALPGGESSAPPPAPLRPSAVR